MENEYLKEIERLRQQVEDLQDQIAIKNGLLEVAQSGILGHGEREEIQACLDKAHKLINPNRLEQSTPGDFLLQLESYVEEFGEQSKMVRDFISRDDTLAWENAELKAEINKYRALYVSVSEMMAQLGADGDISTESATVMTVMDRLYDIDRGVPSNKTPAGDD